MHRIIRLFGIVTVISICALIVPVARFSLWGELIPELGTTIQSRTKTFTPNTSMSSFPTSTDMLSVVPAEDLNSSGFEGGPFSPLTKDYTLTNTGTTPIKWSAAKTKAWVKLSKTSGTLAANDSITVTVSIVLNSAKALDAGAFDDIVTFTNKTNGTGDTTRKVNLLVDAINISLFSPGNLENFTVCTYYPAFGPPTFKWDINGGTLNSLELQFYNNDDPPKKVTVKATATELAQKSLQVKASSWKSILLLPGTGGGEVHWKAVGTKQNNKKTGENNTRSFYVAEPEPVGDPKIDPVNKATLPTLSWNNNCNSKFKVWFYNDPAYYDNPSTPGVKKASLSFTSTNPTDNSGEFIKELTSTQWTSISNLVSEPDQPIYWHLESSDVLKRYSKTDRNEICNNCLSSDTLIVSNASDDVNGDTTNIISLNRKPGPDGISFREAIKAANNTKGPKMIMFSPSIKGSTINMGSAGIEEVIVLTSGDLTINGDLDGDGKPDIILDGSIGVTGPLSVGIAIWSSNNIIKGLSFNNIATVSILFACPDIENISSTISNNKIINNNISSSRGNYGIQVGVCGLLDGKYLPDLSDKAIFDTIISGNTISVGSGMTGICVAAGIGGASRNKITNLTIEKNQISGGLFGICVLASDVASDYFGIYNPIHYSDNNVVENINISDNVVKDFEFGGIVFGGANFGNRDNRILKTRVVNNTISSNVWHWQGISINVAGDSGERSTSYNLIDNIELRQNSITGGNWGIQLRIGDESNGLYAGVSYNQLTNVLIEDNNIKETWDIGIIVSGGSTEVTHSVGSFGNSLECLTISKNEIYSLITGNRIGIAILGGWAIAGPARENKLEQISLLNNNLVNAEIGIWIIGGRGIGAESNDVVVSTIQGNTVDYNSEALRTTDNYEGAGNNKVTIIDQ